MFFRNLTFLRFPVNFSGLFRTSVTDALEGIGAELAECRLKPVGPLELHSRGFISPFGRDCEELSHRSGSCVWIAVGGEDKLLPAAVVNDLLAKKLDEIERVEGRKPGGKTRKRIKDELITELLPKAFVSPSRVDAYLDLARGFIVVDTSSRRTAENVVSEVRRAAGSFPALPVNAEVSPRSVLTGWLAGEPLPEGLALGDECELRDPISEGGVVRIQREDLLSDEVAKHLESGKQCTRLALVYGDHVSFVLGEDMVIRKLKFLDGAVDSLENAERDDLRAELDARFVLMIGEIGLLFDMLERALKITRAESDAPGPASASPTPPKPARTRGQLHGVATVTITAGDTSVTCTAEEFSQLGETVDQFEKAIAIVRGSGNAGISHLQRQLRIGYNRAARLIEAMEERGIVSPPDRTGARTVLAAKEPA